MVSPQESSPSSDHPAGALKSKRGIVRNTAINLISRVILLPIGLLVIPVILRGMGTDRFGIFSLTWVLLNYFAILDFGLSQAATKFIAAELNKGDSRLIPGLFWTSSLIMVGIGMVLTLGAVLISPWLVNQVLRPPQELVLESIRMFQFLAVSIPFVFLNNSLRGTLEAAQRFDLANAVRTPYSALIYLSPLLGYVIGFQIDKLVVLSLIIVILANLVYFFMCAQVYPNLFGGIKFQAPLVRSLLSFSGWVAVTNIISPVLYYLDRFLISGILTVSLLAYYTVPYEALTRLWLIPMSVTTALFPVFSRDTMEIDQSRDMNKILLYAVKYILLILGPITVFVFIYPKEILSLWIDPAFAEISFVVTQFLAVGILINSLGRLPGTLFLGRGHPHIPAKLRILELLIYLPITVICLKKWGINGAAFAWMIRAAADTLLLFIISIKHKDIKLEMKDEHLLAATLSLIGLFIAAWLLKFISSDLSWILQSAIFLVPLSLFAGFAWIKIFDESERLYFKNFITRLIPQRK